MSVFSGGGFVNAPRNCSIFAASGVAVHLEAVAHRVLDLLDLQVSHEPPGERLVGVDRDHGLLRLRLRQLTHVMADGVDLRRERADVLHAHAGARAVEAAGFAFERLGEARADPRARWPR